MNKLDVTSILNQLKTHLATITDGDATTATVENGGTPPTTSTPPNVTADNCNKTVTTEQGAATLTTPAKVTTAKKPKSKFSCTVETDEGENIPYDLPSDTKSFAIENVSAAVGDNEDAPPFQLSAVIVFVEDLAGNIVKNLIPNVTKKFTIKNKQFVITPAEGENIPYDLPPDINSITIEKICSLPLPGIKPAPAPKARIVIETGNTPVTYDLPSNTRKIIFGKSNVSTSIQAVAAENDLPDFLKYTLKIFETTNFEIISDEGDEVNDTGGTATATVTTPSAPVDISGVEVHTATSAQIEIWHSQGSIGYFQTFLRKYGLDFFKSYSCRLFDKYRIGFDFGTEGGSGRGIFPIDNTRYYSILFKKTVPVDAELAEKTLLAFKLADKTPARGMQDIEDFWEF